MAGYGARSRTPSPERVYSYQGVPVSSSVYWTEVAFPLIQQHQEKQPCRLANTPLIQHTADPTTPTYAVDSQHILFDQAAAPMSASLDATQEADEAFYTPRSMSLAEDISQSSDNEEALHLPESASSSNLSVLCAAKLSADTTDAASATESTEPSSFGEDVWCNPNDITPPPPAPVGGRIRRRHRRRRHGEDWPEAADRDTDDEKSGSQAASFDVKDPANIIPLCSPVSLPGGEEQGEEQGYNNAWQILQDFKTAPCRLNKLHDQRRCPFYHCERERRRFVTVESGQPPYTAEPCPEQFEDDGRVCWKGDACTKCHNPTELHYHPDCFRTRLCLHSAQKHCPRRRYCAFAHSKQELLVPVFDEQELNSRSEDFMMQKFKTIWCPISGTHDWENCPYAHTIRDWRRSPLIGYSSRPCPDWPKKLILSSRTCGLDTYNKRCPRGLSCSQAHGPKEQLYHPGSYKVGPCKEVNCTRGASCAFNHGPDDSRQPLRDEKKYKRFAIPNVSALLQEYQPSYSKFPQYHFLDEPRCQQRHGRRAVTKALSSI